MRVLGKKFRNQKLPFPPRELLRFHFGNNRRILRLQNLERNFNEEDFESIPMTNPWHTFLVWPHTTLGDLIFSFEPTFPPWMPNQDSIPGFLHLSYIMTLMTFIKLEERLSGPSATESFTAGWPFEPASSLRVQPTTVAHWLS